MVRFIIFLFGGSISAIGLWHLSQLAKLVGRGGTYYGPEHLYGGGLFVAGGIIMVAGDFIYRRFFLERDEHEYVKSPFEKRQIYHK